MFILLFNFNVIRLAICFFQLILQYFFHIKFFIYERNRFIITKNDFCDLIKMIIFIIPYLFIEFIFEVIQNHFKEFLIVFMKDLRLFLAIFYSNLKHYALIFFIKSNLLPYF